MSAKTINSSDRVALVAATVAVVAASIAGFLVLGSPSRQRQLQSDRARVRDFRRISRDLGRRWRASQEAGESPVLPETLRGDWRDPLTGDPYEYQRLDDTHYELCADFALQSPEPTNALDRNWQHPAGRHCFKFVVTENSPLP